MPKYTKQTRRLKDAQFLDALQRTGSAKEAEKAVGNIGSQGAKDLEASASVMGTKRLKQVNLSILEACLSEGITPGRIANRINFLLSSDRPHIVEKGVIQALKIGVGGGYKPEKVTVEPDGPINTDPEVQSLVDEFEAKLRKYHERGGR